MLTPTPIPAWAPTERPLFLLLSLLEEEDDVGEIEVPAVSVELALELVFVGVVSREPGTERLLLQLNRPLNTLLFSRNLSHEDVMSVLLWKFAAPLTSVSSGRDML